MNKASSDDFDSSAAAAGADAASDSLGQPDQKKQKTGRDEDERILVVAS